MRERIRAIFFTGLVLLVTASPIAAQDGHVLAAEKCASCHDLAGPAPDSFQGILERKAPDLFYAGSKFNRPWLVEWIQSPTRLRYSGVMFLNNIANVDGKDHVKDESVPLCASLLSSDQAEAVTDYLMTLTDPNMEIGVVDFEQSVNESKAFRLFAKQLPCIGCHRTNRGKREVGGISGPDLTHAGARLNPDWIYARIKNPQYWDPMTWMPKVEMSDRKRQTLSLYLSSKK